MNRIEILYLYMKVNEYNVTNTILAKHKIYRNMINKILAKYKSTINEHKNTTFMYINYRTHLS